MKLLTLIQEYLQILDRLLKIQHQEHYPISLHLHPSKLSPIPILPPIRMGSSTIPLEEENDKETSYRYTKPEYTYRCILIYLIDGFSTIGKDIGAK